MLSCLCRNFYGTVQNLSRTEERDMCHSCDEDKEKAIAGEGTQLTEAPGDSEPVVVAVEATTELGTVIEKQKDPSQDNSETTIVNATSTEGETAIQQDPPEGPGDSTIVDPTTSGTGETGTERVAT